MSAFALFRGSSSYACARRSCRSLSTSIVPKTHNVLLFKGDGVGPEIVDATVRIIAASGVHINWKEMEVGHAASLKYGKAISEEHLKAFDEYKVLMKGPLTIPPAASNSYVEIRGTRFTSANQALLIVRENTEDLYTGEEKWVDADTVEAIKRISRGASERIAKAAFELAVKNGRKRVTAVHKANVCKQSDGLFLSSCAKVAKSYPTIKFDDQLADSLLTKLVQVPTQFDVLLCPNLFGDLVSDLAAGLIGSLGFMPSGQFGDHHAVFEPAHGSAPDIAGQNKANPLSMIRSGNMALQHLGEHDAANRIEAASSAVLRGQRHVTYDMGGTTSTTAFTDAVVEQLTR